MHKISVDAFTRKQKTLGYEKKGRRHGVSDALNFLFAHRNKAYELDRVANKFNIASGSILVANNLLYSYKFKVKTIKGKKYILVLSRKKNKNYRGGFYSKKRFARDIRLFQQRERKKREQMEAWHRRYDPKWYERQLRLTRSGLGSLATLGGI